MTPGCRARAVSEVAYFPTLGGTIESFRVRSGLIWSQLVPQLVVFHSMFEAKYSVFGSTGENSTGAVRSTR